MANTDDLPPSVNHEHEHRGIKYPNVVLDSSIDRLKTFEVRPDDIWILTYPKAGTHWMMEIVGLILSNGDPDKVNRSLYSSTVEMINMNQPFPATKKEEELHPMDRTPFLDTIEKAHSPRAMLTHLQYDLLPRDLLKAKVVYLARNPKDIIVSWYLFIGKNTALPLTVEKAINDLVNGEMHWGPWPEHVRKFWDLRNHENVTFVFYEDLKKDPSTHIKRIAEGIGHPISEEVLEQVVKFSHIDAQKETFKKMAESGKGKLVKAAGEFSFLNTDFNFSEDLATNPEVIRGYHDQGYSIVRSLLNQTELTKLQKALDSDDGIRKHAYGLNDGHGRNTRIVIWSHPGNDITGMIARSEKVAGLSQKLLGGEVYHYHTKMIMKEAQTGGRFVWHQDYGYWYKNGCLFPEMMSSTFIAVDKCDKDNGCLQIIPGSHKLGRVEHIMVGGQTGADLERVEFAKKHLGLEFVELKAGDAIFFHCNLLHCSSPNSSDRRRWSFILSYNRKDNDPVIPHHHPQYTPMTIVPNSAILECSDVPDLTGKDFLDPKNDKTVKVEQ